MDKLNYSTYLSAFSWRYSSDEMRQIFSEENKFKLWRSIWVALAKAQHAAGLVSKEELADLKKFQNDVNIERIREIEKETKHDVVAAIREYAEKAKVGGGKIHLGATSMDVVDNADSLRIKQALHLTEQKLLTDLKLLSKLIEEYADYPCLGYTHLQAAEPTTVGYRLAFYAKDLLTDLKFLRFVRDNFQAKGIKGAVGSSASFSELLEGSKIDTFKLEKMVMDDLGLSAAVVSSQVYSRKFDYLVLSVLASVSSSLAKFSSDLRILQSPGFGEWSEPFEQKQVGSSAMPFKKNPRLAEKLCSLARFIASLPQIALENATLSHLERTLDDSANKRVIIAESFLATDEVLMVAEKILKGLQINTQRIDYNLEQFAPFAATESILLEAVKNGANRQEMHETIRQIALKAWNRIQKGKSNPMKVLLCSNKQLSRFVKVNTIVRSIKDAKHIGDAPERARLLVKKIKEETR